MRAMGLLGECLGGSGLWWSALLVISRVYLGPRLLQSPACAMAPALPARAWLQPITASRTRPGPPSAARTSPPGLSFSLRHISSVLELRGAE